MTLESEERPWGSWHVIDVNRGYKIKRIHVNPGSRLSLQTHEHRSEHWVVVSGSATCTIDGTESIGRPGRVGRRAAGRQAPARPTRATEELVIVEVQHGGYTGEDDIVPLRGRLRTHE